MLIIKGDKITKDGANLLRVWQVINDPTEQEKVGAYEIESIPEYPKQKRGKSSIMYYNIDSKEFLFEEEDRPLTPEETAEETRELLVDIREELKKLNEKKQFEMDTLTKQFILGFIPANYFLWTAEVQVTTLSSFIPRTTIF